MHQQSSTTCFNVFPSFLQDITNNSMLIQENKENINPALLGRLSSGGMNQNCNHHDECGVRSGMRSVNCTSQPSNQHINTSLMGDCYTPVMNRHRSHHTGLTPGNNPVRQSRSGGNSYYHVNTTDLSLLAESDVRDSKNSSFFYTPDKQCNVAALPTIIGAADAVAVITTTTTTATNNTINSNTVNNSNNSNTMNAAAAARMDTVPTQPIKLSELFQECAPIGHNPHSPNMSLESILLPRSVLLDSDDDNESELEVQTGKRPRTGENVYRTNVNHHIVPISSQSPSSQGLQEQTLLFQHHHQQQQQQQVLPQQKTHSVAPVPLLFAPPQPVAHYAMMPHDVPPPEYPRNETQNTVTRVVSKTAPLIAVGGRRVPIDKLHILLRPSTPEQMSNNGKDVTFTANKTGVSAPLIPSARPMPAAVKMVSSSSSSTNMMAPVASSTQAMKRRPPSRQHETVILEFARGVQMRFKANTARCVPVVGRHYIASVRSSRSPYDNVAYEDAGVCVQVQRHHAYASPVETAMYDEKGIYDGYIVRELVAADAVRMRELEETRAVALAECRKHFRFLNLPFELVDVYCTFDRSISVVYYSIQPQEGTSGQPNVSRLMRMLQFRLQSKVYLKTITSSE
ncbi:putative ESAG8-associated protein [Trypanosoma theileri]|uniref:Putative ESAG8-associated protein n=1 Tax=Trypanosoma theileri TaxID=67003 RepID=A0A1X0P1W7_9TRYP|nr:putative ESAG8-associated protein [Trypanosoma theileri]ORC90927.1 putative ESAG8-associated protein [Trypanosoma theileri]